MFGLVNNTRGLPMYQRTSCLEQKLVEGKLIIADLGYRSSQPDKKDVFYLPSNYDSKQVATLKAGQEYATKASTAC